MQPFERENRPTWPPPQRESPGPTGIGPESKSLEQLLGEIQYGGSAPPPVARPWRLIPAFLLLVGLGAGGVVGWYWGKKTPPLPPPETVVAVPQDGATAPEGVMAGKDGWWLVWKGEVLRFDAQTAPSTLDPVVPVPAPRERARPRASGEAVTKGYLGVRGKTFQQEGIEGVKILEVFPDSPAAKAGMRSDFDSTPRREGRESEATGHIIVAANGQPMRSEEDLARFMDRSAPGDVMQVVVTSADGAMREALIVVLDDPPQPPAN
jgi:hypothetical protein